MTTIQRFIVGCLLSVVIEVGWKSGLPARQACQSGHISTCLGKLPLSNRAFIVRLFKTPPNTEREQHRNDRTMDDGPAKRRDHRHRYPAAGALLDPCLRSGKKTPKHGRNSGHPALLRLAQEMLERSVSEDGKHPTPAPAECRPGACPMGNGHPTLFAPRRTTPGRGDGPKRRRSLASSPCLAFTHRIHRHPPGSRHRNLLRLGRRLSESP